MRKAFDVVLLLFLIGLLFVPSGVTTFAYGNENPGNLNAESGAISEGQIQILTQQKFSFNGNIPSPPQYVTSSTKTLRSKTAFGVLVSNSTNSKVVRMRVVNAGNGTALTGWKSISPQKKTVLYTPTRDQSVKVQLQSGTSSKMTAKGVWIY